MKPIKTAADRLLEAKGQGHPGDIYQAEIAELRQALSNTCSNCCFWIKGYPHEPHRCINEKVQDMIDSVEFTPFEPPPTFACNQWESK